MKRDDTYVFRNCKGTNDTSDSYRRVPWYIANDGVDAMYTSGHQRDAADKSHRGAG